MTTLGKILVIVNLVFSLVTGALIVMVFVTRTNWRAGFEELSNNLKVANANVETYQEELKEVKKQATATKEGLESDKAKLKDELASVNEQLTSALGDIKKAKTETKEINATSVAATAESQRRKIESEKYQKLVDDLEGRILAFQKQTRDAQDEANQAKVARDSVMERNKNLLDLNETLARENDRLKAQGTGTASTATTITPTATMTPKPPSEDVEGVVLESDARTGLVTINVGSDSGLNKGNTLEVFRLKPKPDYVGMIRIVDARYHESVGRVIGTLRTGAGPIQKGDHVASRIQVH